MPYNIEDLSVATWRSLRSWRFLLTAVGPSEVARSGLIVAPPYNVMSWALLNRLYSRLSSALNRHRLADQEQQGHAFNKQKGSAGERSAYRYLRQQGYKIVARNYRKRFGEVDLIGWDGDTLAFIEVKSRTSHARGRPEEAVHRGKQRQICRVAREYRSRNRLHDINYRFDIVSIEVIAGQEHVELLKGAFGDQRW